jgi:cell division protein FtsB
MLRQYLRPLAAFAALTGLAAYATIMFRAPEGFKAWEEKRAHIQALEEQNAQIQRDIDREKQRIEKLKSDPGTQQVELEKLGLVHRADTQFKIAGQHLTPSNAPNEAK